MNRFGPGRAELWFRFWAGVAGLCGLLVLVMLRGLPSGAGFFEIIVIGCGFFGGSALWSGWKLWSRDHP